MMMLRGADIGSEPFDAEDALKSGVHIAGVSQIAESEVMCVILRSTLRPAVLICNTPWSLS